MPMGDRTGPMGQGPKTGRVAGYCAGMENPGCVHRGPGSGFGRGGGRGRGGHGWRHRFHAGDLSGEQQVQSSLPTAVRPDPATSSGGETTEQGSESLQLRQQVGALQEQLTAIQQRIRRLETTPEPEPGEADRAPA